MLFSAPLSFNLVGSEIWRKCVLLQVAASCNKHSMAVSVVVTRDYNGSAYQDSRQLPWRASAGCVPFQLQTGHPGPSSIQHSDATLNSLHILVASSVVSKPVLVMKYFPQQLESTSRFQIKKCMQLPALYIPMTFSIMSTSLLPSDTQLVAKHCAFHKGSHRVGKGTRPHTIWNVKGSLLVAAISGQ